MPELPEVETTRLGLAPELEGRPSPRWSCAGPDLRWPIPGEIAALLPGQRILGLRRRAKYLLLDLAPGQRPAAPGHDRQPAGAGPEPAGGPP